MLKILHTTLFSVSKPVRTTLSHLTEGNASYMRAYIDSGDNVDILIAYIDDEIVGWATIENDGNKNWFNVYVKSSHRRKGIGTKILKRARRFTIGEVFQVMPWDERSRAFYKSNKCVF